MDRFSHIIRALGSAVSSHQGTPDSLCPIDARELSAIERDFDFKFPAEYREFVSVYGGCAFVNSGRGGMARFSWIDPVPPHVSTDMLTIFDCFYGSSSVGAGSLQLRWNVSASRGSMPGEIVPIAGCFGNDHLCIGVAGEFFGRLYYWDAESEPLDEVTYAADFGMNPPDDYEWSNVHLVAMSFTDFLVSVRFGWPDDDSASG